MIPPNLQLAQLIGLLVCFLMSAFFSGSEAALLSVNRTRVRYLADQGSHRAKHVMNLLAHPRRFLATILIGNNIVNTLAAVLATALAQFYFQSYALSLAAGITTFMLLFFGEVTPKTFSNEHAEWVALRVARPIRAFELLFWPVERGLNALAKPVLVLGRTRVKPAKFHTEEEIKVLLRVGREKGHIGDAEAKMIRAVFEFNDLELADVMVPIGQISTVRESESLSRVAQLVAETGHERYPVLDDWKRPLGIVTAKDLMLMTQEQRAQLTVDAIIRAITRFPPDYHVAAALERMQTEGALMAAVVDSSGQLLGIVTMQDLVEQIVGEFADERELNRARLERERQRLQAVTMQAPEKRPPPPSM